MLAEKIDGPANIAGATSPASDALHANYLALLGLPDNHTGFAAIPLTVLAVIERNAVPPDVRQHDCRRVCAKQAPMMWPLSGLMVSPRRCWAEPESPQPHCRCGSCRWRDLMQSTAAAHVMIRMNHCQGGLFQAKPVATTGPDLPVAR